MKYEILLFDIDNTLLDFDCNEFESFKNTMLDKGIEYTLELYNNYKERSVSDEKIFKFAFIGCYAVGLLVAYCSDCFGKSTGQRRDR